MTRGLRQRHRGSIRSLVTSDAMNPTVRRLPAARWRRLHALVWDGRRRRARPPRPRAGLELPHVGGGGRPPAPARPPGGGGRPPGPRPQRQARRRLRLHHHGRRRRWRSSTPSATTGRCSPASRRAATSSSTSPSASPTGWRRWSVSTAGRSSCRTSGPTGTTAPPSWPRPAWRACPRPTSWPTSAGPTRRGTTPASRPPSPTWRSSTTAPSARGSPSTATWRSSGPCGSTGRRRSSPTSLVPLHLLLVDAGDDWAAAKRVEAERAEAFGVRVRWFPGADHDVHVELPDEVADELHRVAGP